MNKIVKRKLENFLKKNIFLNNINKINISKNTIPICNKPKRKETIKLNLNKKKTKNKIGKLLHHKKN